jgi:hypothetical protein
VFPDPRSLSLETPTSGLLALIRGGACGQAKTLDLRLCGSTEKRRRVRDEETDCDDRCGRLGGAGPQIQQVQTWLGHWGQPTTPMMPGMENPGPSTTPSQSGMNGMMSQEDVAALQNAQGVEASRLFLKQMIGHHQGAITMAQNEINTGQYTRPRLFLARSIVTTQQQEIATMQGILGSL